MHLITTNSEFDETIKLDTATLIDELALYSGVHPDVFEFLRSTYPADDMIARFDDVIYWSCGYSDCLDWLADCLTANVEWSND